jgi:hypothetical protein
MKQRCINPDNHKYPRYGARGIKVADEWLDFRTFESWALANGYKKDLTLDRIDTDGDYKPSNCRWATQSVQQNNRNNNRVISFEGKEYTLAELAKRYNLKQATLSQRLDNGMQVKEAVSKRINFDSILVQIKGETKPLIKWCEQYELPYKTIYARVRRGWDPEEALIKPVRKGNYKRAVHS